MWIDSALSSIIFVTPYSHGPNKGSMGTYAYKMIQELEKQNIYSRVLMVRATNIGYLWRLLYPILDSWTLLKWNDKYIYVHYAFFLNFIFLLPFLFFSRKKVIIQIHEYWKYLPFSRIIRIFDLLYCKLADAIVVHNVEQFRELQELWFWNIHLLQMPIDEYNITEYPHKLETIELLMHGGIIRKKWFDIGIKVMSILPDNYHLTIVWWIWDAIYFRELQEIIQVMNLSSKITIIPEALPDQEYEKYIQGADILLYPYRHGTASAALADGALKFEKVFIASDIQLFRDYLGVDYHYYFDIGSLVSLRDQIMKADRVEIRRFSQDLKDQYSWSKVWAFLSNILHQL